MIDPFNDSTAVETLRALVGIESLSGREENAVRWLVERAGAIGLTARADEAGSAVCERGASAEEDPACTIALLGHIDTVPGRIPVRIEEGELWGRGAVDAKGPLCAFLIAAARASLPPGVRVVVIGAVEEEAATSRGARHVARRLSPDVCVIGEPSGWDAVTLGYKGRLIAACEARRPGAHSAGPDGSPADAVFEWWRRTQDEVAQRNAGRSSAFDLVQASLRSLSTSGDGLEDRASAEAGFRLPTGVDPRAFEKRLRAIAGDTTLTFTGHEHAHRSPRSSPVVAALSAAIREAGGRPRHNVKTGTSDMNVVAPIWGCPIAAYGPGDSSLDHTPEERVAVGEFLRAIEVVRVFLETIPAQLAEARRRADERPCAYDQGHARPPRAPRPPRAEIS